MGTGAQLAPSALKQGKVRTGCTHECCWLPKAWAASMGRLLEGPSLWVMEWDGVGAHPMAGGPGAAR